MKLVEAVIRPERLEAVRHALSFCYVTGMTVCEVKGYGRQRGHTSSYRGAEYVIEFQPKLRLEVAVEDRMVAAVVAAIVRAGATGRIGDGKIFVRELENVVRIRTGEQGEEAL